MDLASLQQQLQQGRSAPLESWHPPFCGEIPIRIDRDGQWFYQQSPMGRIELVKLFSSVLQRKNDQYVLTTPVEEVAIQVDDAPFLLTDWQWQDSDAGPVLQMSTNLGAEYLISTEYPIQLQAEPASGLWLPYLQLARNLTAKMSRAVFYQLADQATVQLIAGQNHFVLQSGRYAFSLGLAEGGIPLATAIESV
jgi:hypothetical protein